jgi:hypothetical protein
MLLVAVSLAFAALPALAGVLPNPPRRSLVLERQVDSNSTSDVANTSTTDPSFIQSILTAPLSNSSAVLADLSILNALPFPFQGRIGFNNATLFNFTIPSTASANWTGPTVEEARKELAKDVGATIVAYEESFLQLAGNLTLTKVFQGGNYRSSLALSPFPPLANPFFLPPRSVGPRR